MAAELRISNLTTFVGRGRWRTLVLAGSVVVSAAVSVGSAPVHAALALGNANDAPLGALSLGDQGAYVDFGSPTKIDLAQFTFETWFRRDGDGVGTSTGTGGIVDFIPLVAHGAPPSVEIVAPNWILLGIDNSTGVLAVDFEDGPLGASVGANHPFVGTTSVGSGVWHHAAATYDGVSWKLYLDGELEATEPVQQSVIFDPAQQISLGVTLRPDGFPSSSARFDGAFDESRVSGTRRCPSPRSRRTSTRKSVPGPGSSHAGAWTTHQA